MPVIFIIIGVLTVALLVAAAIGFLDAKPAGDPVRPFGHQELPEGDFKAADVDAVRFDTVVRGYKMSEVDGVLDRLQERQARLEAQVRTLGGDPGEHVAERPRVAEPVRPAAESRAGLPREDALAPVTQPEVPVDTVVPAQERADRLAGNAHDVADSSGSVGEAAGPGAEDGRESAAAAAKADAVTEPGAEEAPATRRDAKRSRPTWRK